MTTPTLEEMKKKAKMEFSLQHEDYQTNIHNNNWLDNLLTETYITAKREALREVRAIVEEETPSHVTRDVRDTDAMRDRISKRITHLESELNSGAESK